MLGLQSTSSTVGWYDMAIAIVLDPTICAIMYYLGRKTDRFAKSKKTFNLHNYSKICLNLI